MAGFVLLVWLVGAAITKYSLEQMAYFAPIAVAVLGATAAIFLLWVKIIVQAVRSRGSGTRRDDPPTARR